MQVAVGAAALLILTGDAGAAESLQTGSAGVLRLASDAPAPAPKPHHRVVSGGVARSDRTPDQLGDAEVTAMWARGLALERRNDFLAASSAWEPITARYPQESHAYWRIARNYFRAAQVLPPDQAERQKSLYLLAEQWADRGIAVDPRCGECYLYKLAGLGRRLALGNMITAARHASEIASLLDRALELRPAFRDNAWNSELGNVYYAAAAFYRILPDWRWLSWAIGVRGDKRRALDYIRKANEISRDRVDYHVALGATLLCVGRDEDDRRLTQEGVDVLRNVRVLPTHLDTDAIDRRIAGELISQPDRACGYTSHDWIDVDKELKAG